MSQTRSTKPARILLVRQDDMLRCRLAALIQQQPALRVVAAVPDLPAALRAAARTAPDVILLAPPLDDAGVLEAARSLGRQRPGAPLVVLKSWVDSALDGALRGEVAAALVLMELDLRPLMASLEAAAGVVS